MKDIVLVGIGGFIGSVARFKIGELARFFWESARFPLATFIVNIIGCFIIGALAGAATRHDFLNSHLRLLICTGLLGGFTTFSAFGLDTFTLLHGGDWLPAAIYVVATVTIGLLAVWLGYVCGGA